MPILKIVAFTPLLLVATSLVVFGDQAMASNLGGGDNGSTLGVAAFFYGLFHGDNIILLLKGLAPEGKLFLTGLGAGILSICRHFRRA